MEYVILIIVAVIFVIVLIGMIDNMTAGERGKEAVDIITDGLIKQGFTPSNIFLEALSYGLPSDCIAINEEETHIAVLSFRESEKIINPKIFSYKDIMGVEIKHDGATITQTKRASQMAGMAVGGAMLGGVGAIVGGLSGKTEQKTNQNIKKMHLILYIDDINNPIVEVKFYSAGTHATLGEAKNLINHWKRIIEILIRKAEKDIAVSQSNNPLKEHNNTNIIVQLTNLVELKKSGQLTSEEYEALKQKLLETNQTT